MISASAAILISDSPMETKVFTSERKRISRGTTGAAISRVVHQMFAGCPGDRMASILVWPFSDVRLVIRPGLSRTFVCSPGIASESLTLPAAGAGSVKDARPASRASCSPVSSVSANSDCPGRIATAFAPSCASGSGFPSWRAFRMVMPLVSGTLVALRLNTSPSMATVPSTERSEIRSFRSARLSA